MATPQRGGEPLVLNGGSLGELHFEWSHDRYAHRWQFGKNETRICSVESDNSAVWPASPPLQQIHQQEFADGRKVIFGVGMAGRGHWSASFTLIPDLKCWIVELACRSPTEPELLQSAYQLDGTWTECAANTFASAFDAGNGPMTRLQIEAISSSSQARIDNDLLTLHPLNIEKATATTQWAMRLRVATHE
jgi:hypothetical protein